MLSNTTLWLWVPAFAGTTPSLRITRLPHRTSPMLQRRPHTARQPKTVDRRGAAERLEAVQLDAGPLEAALLQHVARGRIDDARAGKQVVRGRIPRRRSRSSRARLRCQNPGPNTRRRASSRSPARRARSCRCRRCRSAPIVLDQEAVSRGSAATWCTNAMASILRIRMRQTARCSPRCGDRWRGAQSLLRPRASACAGSSRSVSRTTRRPRARTGDGQFLQHRPAPVMRAPQRAPNKKGEPVSRLPLRSLQWLRRFQRGPGGTQFHPPFTRPLPRSSEVPTRTCGHWLWCGTRRGLRPWRTEYDPCPCRH